MTRLHTLTVVTGNRSKAAEIEAITGCSVTLHELSLPEIQDLDVRKVAEAKALAAYQIIGSPLVVDDTGMAIEALRGLPGAFVSWFLDTLGPAGILELLPARASRVASVFTCIAFADSTGVRTFLGTIHGTLSHEPKGSHGFGYDPIFIPRGSLKTYAEMSSVEKNAISMRRLALEELTSYLRRA